MWQERSSSCSFSYWNSFWDNYTHTLSFLSFDNFFFSLFLFFLLSHCFALPLKQQIIITTADRPHRWLRAMTMRKTDAANIIIIDQRLTRQRDFDEGKLAPIRNWVINNSNKYYNYQHSLFFSSDSSSPSLSSSSPQLIVY